MANQEEITQYNILQSIESGEQISQRQLSSQLLSEFRNPYLSIE